MKKTILALVLAAGLTSFAGNAKASVITLETTFENSWNGGDAGVPVGNGFFSYTADTAMADGNYNWSSFLNPSVYISFSNGSIFTQNDFQDNPVTTGLGVQISNGQFNFTTLKLAPRSGGGAADFKNLNNDTLSTSPNNPNEGWYSDAAAYMMRGSVNYGGIYGLGSSAATIAPPGAIPEPSTYALLGIGALALVVAYRRKVA